MDWWTLIGSAAGVVVAAALAEEHLDYPGWLADAPVLRWGVNVVIGAATAALIVVGIYFVAAAWNLALIAIAVLGIVLGTPLAVARVWEWLRGGRSGVNDRTHGLSDLRRDRGRDAQSDAGPDAPFGGRDGGR